MTRLFTAEQISRYVTIHFDGKSFIGIPKSQKTEQGLKGKAFKEAKVFYEEERTQEKLDKEKQSICYYLAGLTYVYDLKTTAIKKQIQEHKISKGNHLLRLSTVELFKNKEKYTKKELRDKADQIKKEVYAQVGLPHSETELTHFIKLKKELKELNNSFETELNSFIEKVRFDSSCKLTFYLSIKMLKKMNENKTIYQNAEDFIEKLRGETNYKNRYGSFLWRKDLDGTNKETSILSGVKYKEIYKRLLDENYYLIESDEYHYLP